MSQTTRVPPLIRGTGHRSKLYSAARADSLSKGDPVFCERAWVPCFSHEKLSQAHRNGARRLPPRRTQTSKRCWSRAPLYATMELQPTLGTLLSTSGSCLSASTGSLTKDLADPVLQIQRGEIFQLLNRVRERIRIGICGSLQNVLGLRRHF